MSGMPAEGLNFGQNMRRYAVIHQQRQADHD
jgi:hypothetical protein